ncbi:spore germination lipoprotein GerD [Sporosarcina pasteurii]|uniref:Spore germination GerD central core domain-containing protein n=1 Tax=Sporosarcina pasteurii TaxID=1474 RepID=A0A380CK10_SPOPA|nr:spore germination lipoprotein GerD [Sporosarcina pasteurii]MDS9472042.1 spore germination lipoprotein GerD [Sporosarcina pasteurii]QBQ06770.1 spore gernimation protein [Sporosarcina pasteurii]SUJ20942.1 Uncharacterised protein [Sporosarcina pasteurii]
MKTKFIQLLIVIFLLAGCTQPPQATPSFDEIKKMMKDAIQTEEGKKALRQILTEDDFRELLVLEQPEVKKSIEETLLSKQGEDFWKQAFDDPKFAEKIAKSMKDQQEDVMKQLMGDASFQKQLEEFFGQPDMQKQLESIMKSSTMKEQYEKAIEETINSPLLQTKWEKLIQEAGKGDSKKEKGKEEGQSKEGGEGQ